MRDVGKASHPKMLKQIRTFLDQIADHRDPALEPVGIGLAIIEHRCRKVGLDLVGQHRDLRVQR